MSFSESFQRANNVDVAFEVFAVFPQLIFKID